MFWSQEMKNEKLTPSVIVEALKDVVSRKNQDGTVVLMKLDDSNVFFKIDGIAAQVWEELSNKQSVGELVKKFQEKYPKHADKVESDIDSFLRGLVEKSLVMTQKN